MTDLDKLEELAKAATPGPWVFGTARFGYSHDETHYVEPEVGARNICQVYSADAPRDAEFIAAANPAVVLALIADHRAVLARIAKVEALHPRIVGECHTCSDGNGPKSWPCATVRALTEGENE